MLNRKSSVSDIDCVSEQDSWNDNLFFFFFFFAAIVVCCS